MAPNLSEDVFVKRASLWSAVLALGCFACGGTSVTQIPVGDSRCPNGGLDVKNGNKDQVICDNTPELVTIVPLSVGDTHCPAGGYAVETGFDNGADGGTRLNGTLEPGEISSIQYQCNAGNLLTKESPLSYGDPNCPGGGTRVDVGFDNGAGGGVANNGTLEPGEIQTTQYICAGNGLRVGSFTPPAGAPGSAVIDFSGGNGTDGGGGAAGSLEGYMAQGSLGGHVKFFATGAADAGFVVATVGAPSVGSNPMNVTADTTVFWKPDTTGAGLSAGQYFTAGTTSSPIYLWTGSAAKPVTGVTVASGVTVFFQPNSSGTTNVVLNGPFRNSGKLTTGRLSDGRSAGSLYLNVADYVGDSNSSIDMYGLNATASGQNGGSGGSLQIYAFESVGGAVINQGPINTNGGNGDNGGSGGYIDLEGNYEIVNTAPLSGNGGVGAVNAGGSADYIALYSYYADVNNSGAINGSGGSGLITGGGGAWTYLATRWVGTVRNSAPVVTRGGDVAPGCTTGCVGGSGGYAYWFVYDGAIVSSGDIDTSGGAGAGGVGASAGYIKFYSYQERSGTPYTNSQPSTGSIIISGNLRAHGGTGAIGGAGSPVYAEIDNYRVPNGEEIQFLGYGGGINGKGGSGTTTGGSGGSFTAFNNASQLPGTGYGPGGSVLNTCNADLSGGAGGAGAGGYSGQVDFETDHSYGFTAATEMVINSGNITTNGGAGNSGGGARSISFYASNGVINSGNLIANAGRGQGTTGGNAGGISLLTDIASIANSGALSASGGSSTTGTGGAGSAVVINGDTVQNSGSVTTTGGDGSATGGVGGSVTITSVHGTTANTGTVTTHGGHGSSANGTNGPFTLDGRLTTAN